MPKLHDKFHYFESSKHFHVIFYFSGKKEYEKAGIKVSAWISSKVQLLPESVSWLWTTSNSCGKKFWSAKEKKDAISQKKKFVHFSTSNGCEKFMSKPSKQKCHAIFT